VRPTLSLVVAGLVLAVLLFARSSWAWAGNLAEDASIVASKDVDRAERIHDGRAAEEGGLWNSTVTARFRGKDAFVVFDLGTERPIDALWIQADNDDDYQVDTSLDGAAFDVAWQSGPGSDSGLRARFASGLGLRTRYLRLRAVGGDGNYGVSELQAFETTPDPFPPDVPRVSGIPIERQAHNAILTFGLALLLFVGVALERFGWRFTALAAFAPLLAGYRLVVSIPPGWPLEPDTVSLLRGTVGLVAAVAVARETFGPERFRPDRRAIVGTLAVCAAAAVACFYNLGTPQFFDVAQGRPTFVHYLDLRQYYPTAKYFHEIGYRHVYEADIAAYLEDAPDARMENIADLPMRDLDTHEIFTIGALRPKIESSKARFSPARWEEYKSDARFLRNTMGTNVWLSFLLDYGGNATPVWIGIAHVLFGLGPASEKLFLLTGLFDPLLLGAMFFAIGRTFGVRTALVCMVIFGTNDFIMYGSDWAGATLRHDWLAYLGLGACALRRERWILGGALIGAAATIRAFPGVALVGVLVAPSLWAVQYFRDNKTWPTLAMVREKSSYVIRVLFGAALTICTLVALSMTIVPAAAWLDWSRKVALLSAEVHQSHVGLRSVIGGWTDEQPDILRERAVLFATCIAALLGMIVLACRKRGPSQAAMLALLVVPVAMYPANYYMHLIFLMPIGATVVLRGEREDAPVRIARAQAWIVLLLLSFAQYFAALEGSFALHFFVESAMLIATMVAFLWVIAASPDSTPGGWSSTSRVS
jgi:hypothetical protein